MTDRAAQIDRFLQDTPWAKATRQTVAGDASNRSYDRLTLPDGRSAILMDAPPDKGEDVRPFYQIAAHLRNAGLSAPEIYHQNADLGLLVIEDFGTALFADLMQADSASEIPLYRAAVDVLAQVHHAPLPDLPVCDAAWLTNMTAPLFEWYAPEVTAAQRDCFDRLFAPCARQAEAGKKVLILRDYHAQNLMLLPDRKGVRRVGLLDFQDAMIGHPAYDLVSVLQDARRDVSPDTEAAIIAYALEQCAADPEEFRAVYAILGLQRNLRILGIFARLCLRDGKTQYIDLIPRVWGYVLRNLAHSTLEPLAAHVRTILPSPTPDHLEQLKRRCPQPPIPS